MSEETALTQPAEHTHSAARPSVQMTTGLPDALVESISQRVMQQVDMKTKILAVLPDDSYQKPEPLLLSPDDVAVEVVSSFQYLGSIVQEDCDTSVEVDSRISKASMTFCQLSRTLWYQ